MNERRHMSGDLSTSQLLAKSVHQYRGGWGIKGAKEVASPTRSAILDALENQDNEDLEAAAELDRMEEPANETEDDDDEDIEDSQRQQVVHECCEICQEITESDGWGVPFCGHMACKLCLNRICEHDDVKMRSCPICRKPIASFNQLYLRISRRSAAELEEERKTLESHPSVPRSPPDSDDDFGIPEEDNREDNSVVMTQGTDDDDEFITSDDERFQNAIAECKSPH